MQTVNVNDSLHFGSQGLEKGSHMQWIAYS